MEETITTATSAGYNTSQYADYYYDDYVWCQIVSNDVLIISGVFTCICFCGLVGNVVVVWLLGCRMKRNPFTVYVLNLAVADCSLLLILLAKLTLYLIAAACCIDDSHFSFANGILFILFLFCYFAGMYLLTAMSVERCLAAVFPVWYRCHRSKRFSGITCGVLWTLAALCVALAFISCLIFAVCKEVLDTLSFVNFVLFSVLPLLSNLALFIKLRCGSQRRHPGRLYVAVLLSLIFLLVLGLPFSVEIFIFFHAQSFYISFLLASLNSSINPVLYFLVGSCQQHQFQCSVKAAFQRLFEEEATREERSQETGEAVMETSV
ncbi:mas-related G-protein coupled receptor member X1-like [Pogoniulus pusillus]|uniref:mas-related G-protein coupled receptor member X1-like n=1 Tax=Pogoniulus pusillus TaxID=488313 RepID=UPI0030B94D88